MELNEAKKLIKNEEIRRFNSFRAKEGRCRITISNLNVESINLSGIDFQNVDFDRCVFSNCDLKNANFGNTTFQETNLTKSDLSGANFHLAKNYRLDENRIQSAKFSYNTREPYFSLCREYTGNRFIVILIFTFFAFLPFILSASFWNAVSQFESMDMLAERIDRTQVKESIVFYQLTGLDRGVLPFLLTLILLLYNVARWTVTMAVNRLRFDERQSHTSPSLEGTSILWRTHKILVVFALLALLAALFKAWVFLSAPILIPIPK